MRLSPHPLVTGHFISRPNRFIAEMELAGQTVLAHVPNTGRMQELLVPGAPIKMAYNPSPKRKTDYTLLAVSYHGIWVVIHATIANALGYEFYEKLPGVEDLRREVTYGNSRFDLGFKRAGRLGFCEVKSINLVVDQVALFPDAPTVRGTKHLNELIQAAAAGYDAEVLFVVQREDALALMPNVATDPAFAAALMAAADAGVVIRAARCLVGDEEITLDTEIPVSFENCR